MGAERMDQYLPVLEKKNVAVVVNQTSIVYGEHLVDNLVAQGIHSVTIFGPEHGFRGEADAGEHVISNIDKETGINVISLHGSKKKPTAEDMKNIDIVLFDIQDVGTRFYTYISTLQYVMEACAENKKEIIVLDRPNPNGHYIDGPVLNPKFKSFVGMQAVPVVHGMTIGEYARMLNGEGLLAGKVKCKLTVVPCQFYKHSDVYELPIPPSPNLRSTNAIYLYPSLCFFEGTSISVGRGTDHPFEQFGHPDYQNKFPDQFTPKPGLGSKNPPCNGQVCYGRNLVKSPSEAIASRPKQINLSHLIEMYSRSKDKSKFFIPFFNQLAGTDKLMADIKAKKSEATIRKSWQPAIKKFKTIRKKYLLYPDFE
jgi:uncharacterized protein YbbC (DUF1343 family)